MSSFSFSHKQPGMVDHDSASLSRILLNFSVLPTLCIIFIHSTVVVRGKSNRIITQSGLKCKFMPPYINWALLATWSSLGVPLFGDFSRIDTCSHATFTFQLTNPNIFLFLSLSLSKAAGHPQAPASYLFAPENSTCLIHLKGSDAILPFSKLLLHLFFSPHSSPHSPGSSQIYSFISSISSSPLLLPFRV